MQRGIRKVTLAAGESGLKEETIRGRSGKTGLRVELRKQHGDCRELNESGTFLESRIDRTW